MDFRESGAKPTVKTIRAMFHAVAAPEDEALHQQICYGGVMSPTEAHMRLGLMLARSHQASVYSASIRRYQRKNNVSALHWNRIDYCGRSINVCSIDGMMSPTKADVREMRINKWEIVYFLSDIQRYFKTWHWDESQDEYEEWQDKGWDAAIDQLKECYWISLHFTDSISQIMSVETGEKWEQPDTHFSIQGFEKPPTYDYTSEGCEVWLQLNNSKPSY
jgi:hypothetical protein